MGMRSTASDALRRWADSSDQEARDLRKEHGVAGATPIGQAPDRETVKLRGTVRTLTLMPRGGVPSLEAELDDGTGVVVLVWLGRRRIAGIQVGRAMSVQGRIGLHDHRRVLYNPRYELMP
ncbi:OB-fold nucleic acid binding domain-containing protein [Nocardioides yefusunii]|uniref:OB-fold nucleic acid binding domain-containing protein n=1 Tax=Nocardioides yefusunii TaxID=2500546 RepID=A0ABW1QXD8_9ACTN|nr:OB-fold nucleic acid binding domain-containing protein [Nocardioides yefusunii]